MALKGKGVFTKLALGLYLILSFFGKMFLFLRPIFLIADNNLAMMIVEAHDFEINKLFEGVNYRKRYSSLLLSNLFIEGIMLASAIAFLSPFVIWSVLPTAFYNKIIPPSVFIILVSVVVVVISIMLTLLYSPMGFVACKGKGLSSGDILFLSKEGSKGIKGKVFWLNFLTYLFLGLIFAGFVIVCYLIIYFLREGNQPTILANIFVALILIGFIFLDVFGLIGLRLRLLVSLYSLYYDSVETKHIVVSTRGASQEAYIPLFTDDKEEE